MASIAFDMNTSMGVPQAQGSVLSTITTRTSWCKQADITVRAASYYLSAGQAISSGLVESHGKYGAIMPLETSSFVGRKRLSYFNIRLLRRQRRSVLLPHQQGGQVVSNPTILFQETLLIVMPPSVKLWHDEGVCNWLDSDEKSTALTTLRCFRLPGLYPLDACADQLLSCIASIRSKACFRYAIELHDERLQSITLVPHRICKLVANPGVWRPLQTRGLPGTRWNIFVAVQRSLS